jgi:hypothetical protein
MRLYRLTEDEHMLELDREYPYRETLLARARNHDIQGTSVTEVTMAAKATTVTVTTAVNNYASNVTTVTVVTAVTKYGSKLTTVTVVTAVTKVIIMTTRTWVNLLKKANNGKQ